MTTSTWSTPMDSTTDAGFRTYISEIITKFAAAGLVQTADTGQIDTSTVVRPAANTSAGYTIWRFADSTIYFKLEFGSSNGSTSSPQFWLTVGTGSNGSGTIAGQTTTRARLRGLGNTPTFPIDAVTSRPSYLCVTADFVGFLHKAGHITGGLPSCGFTIGKWTDSAGVAVASGFAVRYPMDDSNSQTLTGISRIESVKTSSVAVTYAQTTMHTIVPGAVTSSSVGADNQVYLAGIITPRVIYDNWMCTIINAELSIATTFSATLVGSTSRTYISLGTQFGSGHSPTIGSVYGHAMLWE